MFFFHLKRCWCKNNKEQLWLTIKNIKQLLFMLHTTLFMSTLVYTHIFWPALWWHIVNVNVLRQKKDTMTKMTVWRQIKYSQLFIVYTRRTGLRSALLLFPMLGVSWIVGFLTNIKSEGLGYAFDVLGSLQVSWGHNGITTQI